MSGHYFSHLIQPLIVPTFHEHIIRFWCHNWLIIWRCSHLIPTLPLGTPSTWWFPAFLSHWNVLKPVILYIVAKFYSWLLFLTWTCHSQGKPGVFSRGTISPDSRTQNVPQNGYVTSFTSPIKGVFIFVGWHTLALSSASLAALALRVATTGA